MGVISSSAPSYSDEELQALRDALKKVGVEYVMATYVDVHGVAKAKTVPIDHFARMVRGSELFTGAAIDVLGQSPADDELAVFPRPRAIEPLPWRPDVACAPGYLYLHGEPYPMCTRTVLQPGRACRERGYMFNFGIETEFYLVRIDERAARRTPATCSSPSYDAVGLLESLESSRADRLHERARLGRPLVRPRGREQPVRVRLLVHRRARDGRPLHAVAADDEEVARKHGVQATFMPKPYGDRTGNGGHFNMSLADSSSRRQPLRADGEDRRGCDVSALAYNFIAGVLRTRPRSAPSPARPSTRTSGS